MEQFHKLMYRIYILDITVHSDSMRDYSVRFKNCWGTHFWEMYEAAFNCTNEKMRFEFKLQVGALMWGAAALSIPNINCDYATKYSGSLHLQIHFFRPLKCLIFFKCICNAVFLLHLLSNLQNYWHHSCRFFLILIHFPPTLLHSHISHLHVVILQILKIISAHSCFLVSSSSSIIKPGTSSPSLPKLLSS